MKKKALTTYTALSAYARMINTMNVSHIADLLSDNFQYKSQLVLNDISCKADYLTFINATLKAIADSEINVQAELGRYGHLGDCVIVIRGDSMSIPDVILAKVEKNHLTLLEVIIAPNIEQIKRSGLFPK